MYIFLRGFRRRMNGGAFNIRGPGLIESVEKGLEISCTIADQNKCVYIYWSLIKASKRHYKSNSIQFKQEESLLYQVRIIFGCIFFVYKTRQEKTMFYLESYTVLCTSTLSK